ncbi:glycosyltransferase family 4 protein [Cyanobacteria bacterium FACHB-471]|nr:glycosyltransferase family 4 protein [Cyanobacteria bacterium FACHB-471]
MKIAFFTHYTTLYGANRSLLNLIDGLKACGVEPYVIAPAEGDVTRALRERGVEFAIYSIQWWVGKIEYIHSSPLDKVYRFAQYRYYALKRLYRNLRLIPLLEKQLKRWNVDLIYTNASVIPTGALVAIKLKLPHVWHMREFIDLDYNFRHDWGKGIFNQLVGRADARIAISKAIYAHLLDKLSPDRNNIVYNGVASISDFDRFREIKKLSIEKNEFFTFAIVGLVHPNKGQDVAIRALASLTQQFLRVRLLIVGGGDSTYVKKLASELNIQDNVEFWGHVDDPYKAFMAADAVLMCSKNEGMGRVTVEAMSACCPVIGYDNAGTSEIIRHGQTGLLYQGDFEALATQMQWCLENPDEIKQIGENAWQFARQKYSIETYAEEVYGVLSSVMKQKDTSSKRKRSLVKQRT